MIGSTLLVIWLLGASGRRSDSVARRMGY
jgi:hypothetical protein